MVFDSVEKILDFAIQKEQEASDFYTRLADSVKNPAMKEVFQEFAKEEQGHKAKLISIQGGKKLAPSEKKILDLKIGDHLVDVDITPDLDYQEALILAMKAEKNAYVLYHEMAQGTDDAEVKELLLGLAAEEAKHKLRFEMEYDDNVLKDN
jgi:rubrerythrin